MPPRKFSVNPQASVPLLRRQLAKKRGKNIFTQESTQRKPVVLNTTASNDINNITHRGQKQVIRAPALLQNVKIINNSNIGEISKENDSKIKEPSADVATSNAENARNPDVISDYVVEIYSHLSEMETRVIIKPGFLQGRQVTPSMRAALVDWLVQVHGRFTLLPDTLQLTIGILDRVLQADASVGWDDLQLLGITATVIASKFEEVCPPPRICPLDLGNLVNLTDGRYSTADVRRMELRVLNTLGWNVSFPVPIQFLVGYSKIGGATAQHHNLAKFLIELSLQEYSLCYLQPSILAAAALHLSQLILPGNIQWSPAQQHDSGYTDEKLRPLICQLASVLEANPTSKLMAIRDK